MSKGPSSAASVIAALAGNTFVTLIKLVAFFASGSGAMLSEAIHSAADTANQALLFVGLRRGTRAADEDFQYGYGGDRFIFGLLSASGIFFVGCGVTIYHGIETLLHPQMPKLGVLTFAVLGVSFLIEGGVLLFAVRSVNKARGSVPFFTYVRNGADPATVAILLEDGVAVSGVLIAALGILAAHYTGIPQFDGAASLIIGVLLGLVAIYLVIENRDLLLGRSVPEGVEDKFIEILRNWPSVVDVHDVKTRELTPETYTLKAEIVFNPSHFAAALREARETVPDGDDELPVLIATTLRTLSMDIDAMEDAIRRAIPQAKHIDIEIHHNKKGEVR